MLARFACAAGFGPVVGRAVRGFAVFHGVHTGLAHMLRIFGHHGDKAVTCIALFLDDGQRAGELRLVLRVGLSVGVGPVNLEHAESYVAGRGCYEALTTLGNMPTPPLHAQTMPVVHYGEGGAARSRSVGGTVLSGVVDIPAPPERLVADWERDIRHLLDMQAGDVEQLSLARTRMRWPQMPQVIAAVQAWLSTWGLQDALTDAEIALMACRGAPTHHDAEQYGGAAFCNVFVSEDKGQDVLFPGTGQRIALQRGTVLVFDTAQPHTVVRRGSSEFDAGDFGADTDCSQVFLTWELPIENLALARALGVTLHTR